jgi:hypothetical protein
MSASLRGATVFDQPQAGQPTVMGAGRIGIVTFPIILVDLAHPRRRARHLEWRSRAEADATKNSLKANPWLKCHFIWSHAKN